jgi:lysophospholipase L1-like esterase
MPSTWHYRPETADVFDANGAPIAHVFRQRAPDIDVDGIGRLIAQAPAMVEALRAIADTTTDANTDYRQLAVLLISIARIAIEEAETPGRVKPSVS